MTTRFCSCSDPSAAFENRSDMVSFPKVDEAIIFQAAERHAHSIAFPVRVVDPRQDGPENLSYKESFRDPRGCGSAAWTLRRRAMTLGWWRGTWSSGQGRTSLRVILAPVLFGLALAAAPARAQEAGERGIDVFEAVCAACHIGGENGAPRIGDRAAWAQRTMLGIDRLVRTAIRGHRGMPPRGGDASLTDSELRSAVIYMASSASARATADRSAKPRTARTGTQ
jgi:cytochrome c5